MKQRPLLDDVDPTARHDEDFYPTPAWQTHALLRRGPIPRNLVARVVEPCVGDGAIVRCLPDYVDVLTNDIVARPPMVPDFMLDARKAETWAAFKRTGELAVVVTNPPFDVAFDIIQHAYDAATVGIAFLLRLSWLEPTQKDSRTVGEEDRGPWLKRYPPTRLIVMPRYDYRHNGKTDSVTSAWMLWAKAQWFCDPGIEVVTKAERDELIAQLGTDR